MGDTSPILQSVDKISTPADHANDDTVPKQRTSFAAARMQMQQLPGRGGTQTIVRLHRLSRWFLDRRLTRLSRLIDRQIRFVYGARIPAEAEIDDSVHFSHNALAVVITKEAIIGPRCEIGIHALLGSRWPRAGGPRLEADVIVHAGAKIIGPVTVGRGSVIGANAVVLQDVPAGSLVVGVPGVVKKSGIRIEDYLPGGQE
jgi:serine O-acetyltransferase